jgi:hypothetical protein
MWILELIVSVWSASETWRLYLSIGIALGLAALIYFAFAGQAWTWFIIIPLAVAGILFGVYWHYNADNNQK